MAQVRARDHAYSPDAAALRAPTVPMASAPLPPTHIAPLPASLIYTPPSNSFPASASSSSVPPLSASSTSASYRLGTPPPLSPTSGIFARRGSILPKVGEGSKSTPSRSSKMEEEIEMSPVRSPAADEAKVKEDQAMAKWRKWAVEQPPQAIAVKPISPPSLSPLRLKPHTVVNVSPGISPNQSRQNSAVSPLSPGRTSRSPSDQLAPGPSKRPSRIDDDVSIFNTESVLALRDVELAIDEEILKSNEGRSRLGSRRMSVVPPPYPESNPFQEIASRLSSRRVRPLVIELIQALGHYIDAVWAMEHPGKPCPWAEPPEVTATPHETDQPKWRSKVISAVAAGKKAGHVEVPITARDARFWEDEVKHGLKDANGAVGIFKGSAWAFDTAIMEGRYGEIHKENVIRGGEHEGGLTRLLHDLEEALWGEAAPRDTDLAYELPIDFDPYARVEDDSPKTPAPTPQENTTDPLAAATAPKPTNTGLMVTTSNDSSGSGPVTIERRIMKVNDWDAELNLGAFKKEGEEEVSLEELGRRRHQQWLESRKADGWDV